MAVSGKQRLSARCSGTPQGTFPLERVSREFTLVFATRTGTKPTQRNLLRDFKLFGTRLGATEGVRFSFHTLRHTFAVNYIRNGGDVFRLQRILGHATLDMTRRYVNLQTGDLQAVHDRLSLLSKRS